MIKEKNNKKKSVYFVVQQEVVNIIKKSPGKKIKFQRKCVRLILFINIILTIKQETFNSDNNCTVRLINMNMGISIF